MERLSYYDELIRIRKALEQTNFPSGRLRFPRFCCDIASEIVKRELGLYHLNGIYDPEGCRVAHNWNYDKERGLYIDLTMDQFNKPYGKTHDAVMVLNYDTSLLHFSSFVTIDEDCVFFDQVSDDIEAFEEAFNVL